MHTGKINNFMSAISDVYLGLSFQEAFPIKNGKFVSNDLTEKHGNSNFSFTYKQDEDNLLHVNLDEQLVFSLFRKTPIKAGNIIGDVEFSTLIFLGKQDKQSLKDDEYGYESYRKISEELFTSYLNLRQGSNGDLIKSMCSRIIFFDKNGIKIGKTTPSFRISIIDEAGHNLYYKLSADLIFPHGAKRKITDVFNLVYDSQFKIIETYGNPTAQDIKNILKGNNIK